MSIDSNCSRHITGFYDLLDTSPFDVEVYGAFDQGKQGKATTQGLLQLGQLYFEKTIFVPGLRETILSLGQLHQKGCVTKNFRLFTEWTIFSRHQILLWPSDTKA